MSSILSYLTQSYWRDEVFAIILARHSLREIVALTSADFNPPLHYFYLHGWMAFFGDSEISLRLSSFLFFFLLLFIVYRFARVFGSQKFAVVITVFTFLNPMLLYYAFEVRMYSMFAFFAVLATYALYTRQWKLYVIASVLGLYTHSFMPLVLLSHIMYELILTQREKQSLRPFVLSSLMAGLCFLPWTPVLFNQVIRSGQSWIYPVDVKLILASLSNVFIGFEGTPDSWWGSMIAISAGLIWCSFLAFKKSPRKSLVFIFLTYVPLILVLTVSLFKPMFVIRYLIFIAVSETFLVGLAIASIPRKWMQITIVFLILFFFLYVNNTFPLAKKKQDLRSVFQTLNVKETDDALIYTDSLVYFEGVYYFHDPSRVFLYVPPKEYLPSYVGNAVIPKEKIVYAFPSERLVYFVSRNGQITRIGRFK